MSDPVKIRALNARFVQAAERGWHDVEAFAEADGVIMDCPGCGEHSVAIWTHSAPPYLEPTPRWTLTGTSLDDLSVTPSVNLLGGCRWHGFIVGGEAVEA